MSENVLDLEQEVFNAVQDYLSQNRAFRISKVVPYLNSYLAKSSINLNKEGIRKALHKLAQKKWIVEGSTLTREEILHNAKRRLIYNTLKNSIGMLCSEISKETEISNYEVHWHMKMLLKFDYVRMTKIQRYKVYYDAEAPVDFIKKSYLKSMDISQAILEFLKQNDLGATKTQMSRELGFHINTVKKYLKTLESSDIVIKEEFKNKTLYFLNEF